MRIDLLCEIVLKHEKIFRALMNISKKLDKEFYLTGGTVRDCVLGREINDIDVTLSCGSEEACKALIAELGKGVFVLLDRQNDAGRVVVNGIAVDFAGFREGADNIVDDLYKRDFTINALGVSLNSLLINGCKPDLLDPHGGYNELLSGVLISCPGAFENDPLRMLRAFRFSALFGFDMPDKLLAEIKLCANLIALVSPERISYELNIIMATNCAAQAFSKMRETGLLFHLIPELKFGVGCEQPACHHLDVFDHNLLALKFVEKIILSPELYFAKDINIIVDYLKNAKMVQNLKWAAVLHDIGKPAKMKIREDKGGRITFYNHDLEGARMVYKLAGDLRWSKVDREFISFMVRMHMYPFHLCNAKREGKLGRKGRVKIIKKLGENLPGLFVLAMSDSLAGQGENKPINMESELADFFHELWALFEQDVKPVVNNPGLLSGNDLIDEFKLKPGPLFAKILNKIQLAQIDGKIRTRQEALLLVESFLEKYQ